MLLTSTLAHAPLIPSHPVPLLVIPCPLLSCSAAKTLLFYFSELNPTLMQWLEAYMVACPIPAVSRMPPNCFVSIVKLLEPAPSPCYSVAALRQVGGM